jgi:hypothetical protein
MTNTSQRSGGRSASKPQLKTQTLKELFDTEFKPREHLIAPWLREGESALIWSEPGVGKSMLSLSVALCIAGGGELMGWKSEKPRRVLVVDGEQHIEDIKERAGLLMGTIDGVDEELASENVTIFARQDQDPRASFPDLVEDSGQDDIFNRAVKGEFDLVILDNFSTLATIEDENSAAAFNPIMNFLLKMKQARIATILVHHANKSGKGFRGSTKLETTFEVTLGLQKPTSGEKRFGTAFDVVWTKYRRLKDETVSGRSVWLDGDPLVWGYKVSQHEEVNEMVRLVRTHDFTTQAQLAKTMNNMAVGKLSKLKHKAFEENLISHAEWKECLEGPFDDFDDDDPQF